VVKRGSSGFDEHGTFLHQVDQEQGRLLRSGANAAGTNAPLSHLVTGSKKRSVIIDGCGGMSLQRMVAPIFQTKKDNRFDPF
jgi:hypothetical protein